MNTRTVWAAAAAVVALAVVPACSSDDSADDTAATTTTSDTTTNATTTTAAAAAATAADLQPQLDVFFDPTSTVDAKAAVVENGADLTAVLEQFNGVLAGYPLTATVGDVTGVDADTVTATTDVAGPHGGAPMDLTFTDVDGTWVLATDSTCSILEMGHLSC
ncbi:MAG: nuclear transport factor 2 family protein [Rhodococcus sp.]|uniref:nuclear transport factor 2 family protein n=1 Tax=Rhodococcus TaxID=1827 RepID=UPI00169033DC|nr:nuclear transport factor 2 family protein [Rhodococcus sp. (in: high G+C Gram-positive bacteria)]NLV80457.1 nuclear transport factor 2 family protein [Rhodococcus sp. (in: high G+C Gram-positive bacteria)]